MKHDMISVIFFQASAISIQMQNNQQNHDRQWDRKLSTGIWQLIYFYSNTHIHLCDASVYI